MIIIKVVHNGVEYSGWLNLNTLRKNKRGSRFYKNLKKGDVGLIGTVFREDAKVKIKEKNKIPGLYITEDDRSEVENEMWDRIGYGKTNINKLIINVSLSNFNLYHNGDKETFKQRLVFASIKNTTRELLKLNCMKTKAKGKVDLDYLRSLLELADVLKISCKDMDPTLHDSNIEERDFYKEEVGKFFEELHDLKVNIKELDKLLNLRNKYK